MMDCTAYRRSILAEPRSPSAEMRRHVASCPECTAYTARILRFEGRLERALQVSAQAQREGHGSPRAATLLRAGRGLRMRRRAFAVAASVFAAVVVAGSLWLGVPRPSLAADVVEHMAEEPNAWARTQLPVPPPRLDRVLSESHVRLKSDAGLVTYANSCPFRGHVVPHLVVQTDAGPVTVMVLSHESVRAATEFDEQGYRGEIVPVPHHGSLAVLQRGPGTDLKAVQGVAARVLGAIEWTN